jgi:hypothetical protein
MVMWPIVSVLGFLALTAVIVVLGTGSTARYEAERRQPAAADPAAAAYEPAASPA